MDINSVTNFKVGEDHADPLTVKGIIQVMWHTDAALTLMQHFMFSNFYGWIILTG